MLYCYFSYLYRFTVVDNNFNLTYNVALISLCLLYDEVKDLTNTSETSYWPQTPCLKRSMTTYGFNTDYYLLN